MIFVYSCFVLQFSLIAQLTIKLPACHISFVRHRQLDKLLFESEVRNHKAPGNGHTWSPLEDDLHSSIYRNTDAIQEQIDQEVIS